MNDDVVKLALDLGTTTLGGRLISGRGEVLAAAQHPNPQGRFGADVIRRLEAARNGDDERLQELLLEGIDALIVTLLGSSGHHRSEIAAAAAAGNPAICHLLCRYPVDPLLFPPHRSPNPQGRLIPPTELPLNLPVPLFLFPLVSGFVGGDLVAFLFGLDPVVEGTLVVDVGTNGEIALFDGAGWWATSVAAGPAFEGGDISSGMAWREGAVEGVEREGDRWRLQVVGGGTPRGVCGSGLAEVIAAALEDGLIDGRGRIVAPLEVSTNLARYIVPGEKGNDLRLYRGAAEEVVLTQEDVRHFQLAKGAVHAGVRCLTERAGFSGEQIREVVLTGAFGFSLRSSVLKRVAMLPENMLDKVRFFSDGVLHGLCRALTETEGVERVEDLARRIRPFPLSGTPAFEEAFLQALNF